MEFTTWPLMLQVEQMQNNALAFPVLFVAGLTFSMIGQVHAAVPSWVDNNPANAPQICQYGACCAMPSCPAPAPKAHRCGCLARLKSCKLARLARRCGCLMNRCCAQTCGNDACSCGAGCDSCGSGCGADGCGGYSGCDEQHVDGMPSGDYQSDENVIYDGPAPGSVIQEGPTSTAPGMTSPSAARNNPSPYQLVSASQQAGAGSAAFNKGVAAYRSQALNEALGHFEIAVSDEPDNALYHYYLALTFHELHGADAGIDVLRQAVVLEQRKPIANWGKRMERVQGRARLWIEKARREAGLAG